MFFKMLTYTLFLKITLFYNYLKIFITISIHIFLQQIIRNIFSLIQAIKTNKLKVMKSTRKALKKH